MVATRLVRPLTACGDEVGVRRVSTSAMHGESLTRIAIAIRLSPHAGERFDEFIAHIAL